MQCLLAHGHRLDDIRNYNIDQMIAFLDAAERADAVSRMAFTVDIAAVLSGVMGSKDSIQKHLASLQDTAKGE